MWVGLLRVHAKYTSCMQCASLFTRQNDVTWRQCRRCNLPLKNILVHRGVLISCNRKSLLFPDQFFQQVQDIPTCHLKTCSIFEKKKCGNHVCLPPNVNTAFVMHIFWGGKAIIAWVYWKNWVVQNGYSYFLCMPCWCIINAIFPFKHVYTLHCLFVLICPQNMLS